MKRSFAAGILAALALSLTAAESPYGVCAHLNRMPQEEMRRELAGIAATGIGFYKVAEVIPTVGAYRAYMNAETADAAGINVSRLILGGDDVTEDPLT